VAAGVVAAGVEAAGVEAAMCAAQDLIGGASQLALACHLAPDGDALGSMLALHHLATAHGVASVASWPEPFVVAPHYQFLPGLDLMTKPCDFPAHPELMATFDCGSLTRLGELAVPAQAACRDGRLVVLDHHATNDGYGSVNVIDPQAAATAVVVRELARRLGWDLTRDAAICLYTGLVTDTGRFQYSNTTPSVFALAEELSGFDLPIADMSRQLFEQHRFAYLKLVATCLARVELDPDLHFVATWVTAEDFARYDVSVDETEGLIDLVRRTGEAEVSCVLKETPEGIRVSLRAISKTDVGAIATRFGGGGHQFAAGFTSPGTVADVLAEIRLALANP
ncbi:MAG: bifunctional oligoribonuclease/PAP phosphatase NrnA, partial [Actinomycetota bacterium]|nr:bifunctional oligoribonuclease/PAP phosphatase NrnA [Actinomycetota bacterium]